MVTSLAA